MCSNTDDFEDIWTSLCPSLSYLELRTMLQECNILPSKVIHVHCAMMSDQPIELSLVSIEIPGKMLLNCVVAMCSNTDGFDDIWTPLCPSLYSLELRTIL